MNVHLNEFSGMSAGVCKKAESAENSITFRNVTKRYGSLTALHNLTFTIQGGTFVSLLGPSGCGKTTTLRLIAGFDYPSEGSISINGVDVGTSPAYERPVNMVFQNYALFPHLNVFDNIAYGLRSRRRRCSKAEVEERVATVIEKVQLADKQRARIWHLSGGQQQRVALARAIVNNPKILILDEPLAALDKKLRRDVQFELQSLQRALGITFVMVTHDQHEALSLSDSIIVMNKGGIEQIGTPHELYNQPTSKFVASFIGDFNLSPTRVVETGDGWCSVIIDGRKIRIDGPQASKAPNGEVHFGFRPDDVLLLPKEMAHPAIIADARITNIIYLGEKAEIRLSSPGLGEVIARIGTPELFEHSLSIGQNVGVGVHSKCRRIF